MCTFKNEQTVMLCDVALSTGYTSGCKNPSVRQFSTPWLRGKERSFRRDRQSIRRDFRRWLTRLFVNLLASWEEICIFHGPHDIALLPQRDRTSHVMSEVPPMKRANLQVSPEKVVNNPNALGSYRVLVVWI